MSEVPFVVKVLLPNGPAAPSQEGWIRFYVAYFCFYGHTGMTIDEIQMPDETERVFKCKTKECSQRIRVRAKGLDDYEPSFI